LEWMLGGKTGDLLEKLKFIQISQIKRGLEESIKHDGRVSWSDDELEFHPEGALDTRRHIGL
ncbi:MAG: hypothetical protein NUV96_02600, partial [Candidatus Colwellbacteria bacterium]|nr:hypothetical protein [Candidatus Colwellbacteria bacterium]